MLNFLELAISEPQLEHKVCRIVSENGIGTISKGGQYLFHAILVHSSYVFKPNLLPMSSQILQPEEIALASTTVQAQSADLWHLRLGHLNFQDMQKLKQEATGISFPGDLSFCEDCATIKCTNKPFITAGD